MCTESIKSISSLACSVLTLIYGLTVHEVCKFGDSVNPVVAEQLRTSSALDSSASAGPQSLGPHQLLTAQDGSATAGTHSLGPHQLLPAQESSATAGPHSLGSHQLLPAQDGSATAGAQSYTRYRVQHSACVDC